MSNAKELLSSRSEIVIESFTPCKPAVNKIEKRRRETNRKHKTALQLDFIQCPFPNQIQFGLEKIHPKNASDFPNQFQFGLERKNGILQDADSKPNSDWFGKN